MSPALKIVLSFWIVVISFFIVTKTALADNPLCSSDTTHQKWDSTKQYTITGSSNTCSNPNDCIVSSNSDPGTGSLSVTCEPPLGNVSANSPTDPGAAPSTENYTPPVHTGYTIQNMISNLAGCLVIGGALVPDGATAAGCPSYDQTGNLKIYKAGIPGGGALGGVSNIMVAMYNHPPTSTQEYLADLGSNLGLVDKAYAQGVGGSGDSILQPILNMWKVFRNIAYLLFILVFMAVGIMIMLRRRLNPQTVISVQAALPGLIIGLILVTFSYFIAALIVDMSFVGMKVVAFIFEQSGLPNIIQEGHVVFSTLSPSQLASNGNIFSLWWTFIANKSLIQNIINPLTQYFDVTSTVTSFFDSNVTGGAGVNIFGIVINPAAVVGGLTGYVTQAVGFTIGILVAAIIIIALLIQMLRLLWALVSAYITILIFSIFGPLLIAVGSIPGRGGTITYWWKTLLGNVLIFPAVFFVFLFAGMFLANASTNGAGQFTTTLPLFAGIQIPVLKAIIGYGIVLGAPAIPGMVKKALGVEDITALQQAAFAGVGSGVAIPKQGIQYAARPLVAERQAFREGYLRSKYTLPAGEEAETARKNITRSRPWLGWLNRF
ncbi:hypothetical protein HY025_02755 [Candidatus Daviesbacteria bacterium]|nr:hypothetical protein [Candidatus Daviesbacteria bacterium]